jgi:dienelactone hydrolase
MSGSNAVKHLRFLLLRSLALPALLAIFTVSGLLAEPTRSDPLGGVEEVMGPLPKIDHHARLDVDVRETVRLPHYVLRNLTFVSEPGSRVHAWLLVPDGAHAAPAVLCLHETTEIGKDEPAGLGGNPNMHYARELALRGYVTLAPDYMHYGEDKTNYQTDVYARGYWSGSMKGIVNNIRAVDLLVSLAEVDPNRIGVIGHSLGGHNSLFVAAFDPRIRASVISSGFTAKSRYHGGNLLAWSQEGYMPLIESRYHSLPREVPFDFSDFLRAIVPRAVFINAPLHDEIFDVTGVDESISQVAGLFPDHRLLVLHPDCAHDFPGEIREQAYRFLDRELK